MKKILSLLSALFITAALFTAKADSLAYPVTANVVSNLLTNPRTINNITATATSTNITTFYFYDTSNTSTSIVRAAYQNWASYATNFSTIFTNESDVIITNTFEGVWTYPTSVSAVTNARPVTLTIVVPAGTTRSKDVRLRTLHGLAVIPNQDGIVEVDYTR